MFNQTFIDGTEKTKKPLTVLLSVAMQLSAICLLILIPLVYTQALPNAQLKEQIVAPAPPPAAAPVAPTSKVEARTLNRRFKLELIAPVVIPNRVNTVSDAAPAADIGVFGSTGDANAGSNSPISIIGSVPEPAAPPPPAPQPKKARSPIRVATGVSEANLIRKVQPAYPPLAKSARIQGVVEFTAVISKEGNIEHLQLVRDHPLLVNAAKEAVLQWKYRPTLLNGEPVEVITDILVNFTLTQ